MARGGSVGVMVAVGWRVAVGEGDGVGVCGAGGMGEAGTGVGSRARVAGAEILAEQDQGNRQEQASVNAAYAHRWIILHRNLDGWRMSPGEL